MDNPFKNQIDIWEIYKQFPEEVIIKDRNIFDFSIVKACGDKLVVVWSEYYPEIDEEVNIYSCCYGYENCSKPMILHKSHYASPYIKMAVGRNCKIHLLLSHSRGLSNELVLKTYNGTSWEPETKIADMESFTFGQNIVPSQKREKIYVIFGDYRELHTFPYILTAIFTGHTAKEFGKLFLIQGNGISWNKPRRVTKTGRFSTLNPSICLNDEMDILHIAWEDERLGYKKRTIYYDSFDGDDFSGNKRISGKLLGASLPSIACDNKNNIYIVWSTFDKDGAGKLYFRERINNSWSDVMELASKGALNSVTTDTLGNVHFVWDDGSKIYYKIKTESFWTNTVTFIGDKARIFIDKANDVHFLLLRREEQRKYALIYNILKMNK
ncbi:MAG: hypothetical protein HF976_16125 [ANME-2 cluster archaeon]|nr:hypothetical protein [ANME-2 cluster archaeon]MBC2708378.1 hypothetical protein [ANME-2 cluster archaeon]MBC2747534.1 hypothetical protein [ANME-2 cluster archaeon]